MTRDPARIGPTLDAVRRYWEDHPDLRLGQVLCNAALHGPTRLEVFYMEDGELRDKLRAMERER